MGTLSAGACLPSPHALFHCGAASMAVKLPSLLGIASVLEADLLASIETDNED